MIVFGTVNRYHLAMAQRVMRALPITSTAMVSFASPYYLESVPDIDAYVCTYSYLDDAQRAAADALVGGYAMTGRLPVTIPGFYEYGHRVENRVAQADYMQRRPNGSAEPSPRQLRGRFADNASEKPKLGCVYLVHSRGRRLTTLNAERHGTSSSHSARSLRSTN